MSAGIPVKINATFTFIFYSKLLFQKVEEEQCAKAAEIYQCGKEKAPEVTSAIRNSLTSDQLVDGVKKSHDFCNLIKNCVSGHDFCSMRPGRQKILQIEGPAMHSECI
jgi:hypothetical protein